ncbi:alkaline phosphatase family protein [Bowdeniella nasicola]|uniref:alkaline phosphatase family protein n=1 Tax=Bowdeniella nasicola TaxID=208480 RepID=UPI0009FAF634|nr:nucleotide pyrophosphatase/phosphodiesterase family protein [Bowdeniella nasicola]
MTELRQVFAAAAHGAGYRPSDGGSWAESAQALELPAASRYVVVLIDGMGLELLEARRGHIPFMRRRLGTALTSTFPSTTACAITSFATGERPGHTGMVGFTAREPDSQSRIQLLSFADSPVTPEAWQRCPTIAERATPSGEIVSVGPEKFRDSGLTRAAWRGMRAVFAETFEDRIGAVVRELRAGASLVYLYWADLDHVGHVEGWSSEAWIAEVERVDAALSSLASRLPKDTALIVTADHGMVDIDRRLDLADFSGSAALMSTGEERVLQLFFEPGTNAEQMLHDLAAWCGESVEVWDRTRLLTAFDPVADHVSPRIGDAALIAKGTWGISDSRWMSDANMRLVGAHGSISSAEVSVPLIIEHV